MTPRPTPAYGAAGPSAVAEAAAELAARFDPISLESLGGATLLEREDSRFMLPSGLVPPLLERLAGRYRILEVGGSRAGGYLTRYFDTPDLAFYRAHHAGRRPRFKVRIRAYRGSDPAYLEVKRKTNRNRTIKTRVPLAWEEGTPERVRREALLRGVGALPSATLESSLFAEFTRFTLVGAGAPERVTVDLDLGFARDGRTLELPGLAIVEIKQDRHGRAFAREALRELGVREGSLSKYCLGIASLEPGAKRNRFLPALRRVGRILGTDALRRAA